MPAAADAGVVGVGLGSALESPRAAGFGRNLRR